MGKRSNVDPTRTQFNAYADAFDYFNDRLFGGQLPRVFLNFSRKARSMGFFAPERWFAEEGITHEISLNPDVLHLPIRETMQTLVHEMAHLWQQEFGKPSRNGYHNAEWAETMNRIGLIPSDTGAPGGKQTGQKMSDYVLPDGPFDRAFKTMPKGCLLPWLSSAPPDKPKDSRGSLRLKYTCPDCGINAWGKPGLGIRCVECEADLVPEVLDQVEADEPAERSMSLSGAGL